MPATRGEPGLSVIWTPVEACCAALLVLVQGPGDSAAPVTPAAARLHTHALVPAPWGPCCPFTGSHAPQWDDPAAGGPWRGTQVRKPIYLFLFLFVGFIVLAVTGLSNCLLTGQRCR